MTYPRLDDVVKAEDVSSKGTGKFAADYVNWARIAAYLREHAPEWQPFAFPAPDGGIAHAAPDGSYYLLIGFRSKTTATECVPHAVMDHKMNAKKNPDARDIADAYVRGMCKAAALLFGLGWQLWSKDDPLERGDPEPQAKPKAAPRTVEPWPSVEHAIAALDEIKDVSSRNEWAARTKAARFRDGDKAALDEALARRKANNQPANA